MIGRRVLCAAVAATGASVSLRNFAKCGHDKLPEAEADVKGAPTKSVQVWASRWRDGRASWHKTEPNSELVDHLAVFEGKSKILLPLCGRSVDVPYLMGAGFDVVGVEGVRTPVRLLLNEDVGISASSKALSETCELLEGVSDRTKKYVGIAVGDYFNLDPKSFTKATKGAADGCWDRGSYVAVFPSQRDDYLRQLNRLLQPGAVLLLSTFRYDPRRSAGPPWPTTDEEVRADLRRAGFGDIRLVATSPVWVERGKKDYYSVLYTATKKSQV